MHAAVVRACSAVWNHVPRPLFLIDMATDKKPACSQSIAVSLGTEAEEVVTNKQIQVAVFVLGEGVDVEVRKRHQ